jgi:tetratricopeptide (TPR) repeat protein
MGAVRRTRVLLLGAVAAVLTLTAHAQPAEPLVARYARGDFAALNSITAERASDLNALRKDVKAATSVSPQVRAAFLVEAIDAAQHRPYSRIDQPRVIDEAIRGMFQDGCDLVRTLPADTPFVRLWYPAAVAVLAGGRAGVGMPSFSGQGDLPGIFERDASRFEGHVDPGTIVLGQALAIEALAWTGIYQSRADEHVTATTSADFSDRIETGRRQRVLADEAQSVRRALVALRQAQAFDASRSESLMRQGALIAASGKPADALSSFDESLSQGHDAWVQYLAYLLKGRALEAIDRGADAETAYRAALALRPRARSVNLALAAVTFARGVRSDAALAVVFDRASDEVDPWAQFANGDYRLWPARRDALRRAIQ